MKHHFNIFTMLIFVISAHGCAAMETLTIPHANFKELTTAIKPRQALYLTNNRIAISDINGCSIIDPTTDTLIKQISCISYPHIALHPNTTKIALAYPENVTIYNATTGEQEWTTKSILYRKTIASSQFNPFYDIIFISYTNAHAITRHTYPNNSYWFFATGDAHRAITFHPTEYLMCVADNPGDMTIINQKTYATEAVLKNNANHNFCEYSPNGSIIASGSKKGIYISDPAQQTSLKIEKGANVTCIKFHPNSAVLATLSNPGSIVRYWDVVTQQLIIAMAPLSADFFNNNNSISFSPDGNNLVIPLPDKCIVMPVPFEVIYQPDDKEKAVLAYWLLNNNQHTILPRDVTQLLMYTLIKMFKQR